MTELTIAWFRQDLRIQDNSMLAAIAGGQRPVLPLYIDAPQEAGSWPAGGASNWWLHHALAGLKKDLNAIGLPLILRQGDSLRELEKLVTSLAANGLHVSKVICNRLFEPSAVARDERVSCWLAGQDICWQQSTSSVLIEPEFVRNKSGLPYRVFTPFWKQLRQLPLEPAVPVNTRQLRAPSKLPDSLPLEQLNLLPTIPWDHGLKQHWQPSSQGAHRAMTDFLDAPVNHYKTDRDRPDRVGTSSLSPYLHFGQIGPRQVWAATHAAGAQDAAGGLTFLSELGWREFAYHLLHHFPDSDLQALNSRYASFPWEPDQNLLQAWQQGQTGYPFVDAGMRQLWHTGWMHNRVRMVVASFLVKHLLQPWQDGARWFWDTLVDADLASNSMGWQWVAGSGADAAPYFRIFNPFGQGEKFDPDGDYVRQWVPELAQMPTKFIHRPWDASALDLKMAGVSLGQNYPLPIIEHRAGRERALAALAGIK